MTLIFYSSPMSTATITELVLEELGIAHDRVRLDLKKGETKNPDFLKLNPNGRVPCIVHDGTPIWESAAITMYLGETFGVDNGLYPAPGPARGRAMTWITWTNVTVSEAFYRYSRNTSEWFPAENQNAAAGAIGKTDTANCLRILDEHLAQNQYMLGSQYTLVDTHLNSFTDWLRYSKFDFSAYPHLNEWSARCTSRPAYIKVMSAATPPA